MNRLDTLQAAVLEVKLKFLKQYEHARNRAADLYDQKLSKTPFIQTPVRSAFSTHVFHQYTLKVKGIDRNNFKSYLERHGVPSMVYYPIPLHLQQAYRTEALAEGSFPVSEGLSKQVLSLPMHTEMDEEQLHYICEVINNYGG
jgi:UDP-2-acetamido-2-deoxy-ribo-hexuluronate aminotransferase